MPSTFLGLSIGASALNANMVAENVVGQNIANANTPGYSVETANMVTSSPYTPADGTTILQPGMIGTGVTVGSITRATDAYTTAQLYNAQSDQSYSTAQQNALNQVQDAFNEPSSNGLSNAMDTFFESFQNIANNPSDPGVAAATIQDGVALTSVFNNLSQQFSETASGLSTQLNSDMTTLNNDASQIATLNVSISQSLAQGQQPNDLMDQRDSLINSISSLANVNVTTQPNGMVNISAGNTNLVLGTDAYTATTTSLQANNGLSSGEIAGLLQSQTQVAGYQSNLDNLAKQVVTAVNQVQYSGSDAYGNTGSSGTNPASPFFTTTGTTAGTITVNPALINDPNLLAVSAAGTPGTPPAAGDVSNASNFTSIQSTPIAALDNMSPDDYYQNMVSSVGSAAAAATTEVNNTTASVTQLTQQQDSVTGVSTDDEMTEMMQYQEAYQAAARFVTTSDDLLTDLMSMGSTAS